MPPARRRLPIARRAAATRSSSSEAMPSVASMLRSVFERAGPGAAEGPRVGGRSRRDDAVERQRGPDAGGLEHQSRSDHRRCVRVRADRSDRGADRGPCDRRGAAVRAADLRMSARGNRGRAAVAARRRRCRDGRCRRRPGRRADDRCAEPALRRDGGRRRASRPRPWHRGCLRRRCTDPREPARGRHLRGRACAAEAVGRRPSRADRRTPRDRTASASRLGPSATSTRWRASDRPASWPRCWR